MGWLARILGREPTAAFVRGRIEADLQRLGFPEDVPGLPQLPANDPLARIGSPPAKVLVELPTINPGASNQPAAVLAALASHDQGDFRVSGLLMQALLRDPAIRGPLDVRCKALTGLPITFKPVNDSPRAIECADIVRAHFREWLTCEEHEKFMRCRLLMGASLAQPIWNKRDVLDLKPMMFPEVNCWEPIWIYWYWDGNHRNFGRWQVINMNGVVEPIGGGGDWVWALNTRKDPQFTGLIRSLALRFVLRQQTIQNLGKYCQRYAFAILKLKHPSTFDEADVANIASQLTVDGNAMVTLPQGDSPGASFDVEWASINSTSGWQVFIETLAAIKAEIAIDILGQTLTTDTGANGGGAHSLGKVHEGVPHKLLCADATQEASIWREQLLKPFAALNYGDPELAPLMEWEVDPVEDLSLKATTLAELARFLATVPESSNVDRDALYAQFGVPLKKD